MAGYIFFLYFCMNLFILSVFMKISYNWLKDYINLELPPAELGNVLTNIGLEVEGMESFETVKGGMEGCYIGQVKTCRKHPNADKLSLTTVDIGGERHLDIVCGAPNVRAGQKVVVATVGTTLHQGGNSLTLKKVKIRGEHSEGMICAEDEIGLGDSHDGIMVLDKDAEIGLSAREYFNLVTDTVYEIGLTPNRIDGASHYGVARDLAAWLSLNGGARLKKPSTDAFSIDNNDLQIGVRIDNQEACKRYTGVTLSGITVKDSPQWLKNRLLSVGLTPINNVVDITNFVLFELGQPLHAFDADRIGGKTIVVRTMKEGTRFVTLDEVERTLSADDLMICDDKDGMCIGGVFGGIHSGVTQATKNLFLESAWFDPVYIRRTSRRHGLNTDASFRFERGADPEMTIFALKRAAALIREIAGGTISSGIVDVYPVKMEPCRVELRYAHIDRLIGIRIERKTIEKILHSLEIKILSRSEEGMEVSVPLYRVDVQREADVIEEILRIYGYDNVGFAERMNSKVTHTEKPEKEKLVQIVSDHLSSNGFNEIMCNSLTREAYYTDDRSAVRLFNPLSSDLNRMRTNLLYGGLETIIYNINRKRSNLRLYEFGNCYHMAPESSPDILDTYEEEEHLAIFITGKRYEGNWIEKDQPGSFYELKTYVEHVFERLGIRTGDLETRPPDSTYFDDGMGYWKKGKKLAEMGMVSSALLNQFEITAPVYYADFIWDHIMDAVRTVKITLEPMPRYPEVRRDLSMIIDRRVTFAEIREIALASEKKLLKSVSLFDVYESDRLEKGKKSYAMAFVLQNPEKTLTDKEIDRIMDHIQANLEKKVHALIRQAKS
jgi:phenylalanyl-tRNA synthetase beta chain